MVDNDKLEQKTKDAIIDQQKSIADNSGKKQKKHIIPVGNIDTFQRMKTLILLEVIPLSMELFLTIHLNMLFITL